MTRPAGPAAHNPILDAINATADDPSVAVYLPVPLAESLIELAGGARRVAGPGRWIFPDGFWTWETSEALRYALEVLPDFVADELEAESDRDGR